MFVQVCPAIGVRTEHAVVCNFLFVDFFLSNPLFLNPFLVDCHCPPLHAKIFGKNYCTERTCEQRPHRSKMRLNASCGARKCAVYQCRQHTETRFTNQITRRRRL